MSESFITVRATSEDYHINQMIEVCEENLIEKNNKLSEEELSKKGFLVRKINFADTKKFLDDTKNSFVFLVKEGERVLGYISANDIIKNGEKFRTQVLTHEKLKDSDRKVLYYNQIAKRRDVIGVGKKLITAMLEEATKRNYHYIVCQIVHKPFFNEASISFHKKFGFEAIGEIEDEGRILGIYLKNL